MVPAVTGSSFPAGTEAYPRSGALSTCEPLENKGTALFPLLLPRSTPHRAYRAPVAAALFDKPTPANSQVRQPRPHMELDLHVIPANLAANAMSSTAAGAGVFRREAVVHCEEAHAGLSEI
ncbi:hypothetical protein VUR80DRAFT_170 [Thermomyces stellatus]